MRMSVSQLLRHGMLLLFVFTVILTTCLTVFAENASIVAGNTSYHCRRPFGTGLYDSTVNKTFITYSGAEMDVYVKAFNHATNSWEPGIKVYDWNDSSQFAYHDYTTMAMLPDGKIGLFICDHTQAAYLIKAPTPHSLSGTWTRTRISNDLNCYAMPIVVGSDTYFFYSRNDDLSWPYRTYRYIKSSDSGSSWTAPQTVINSGKNIDRFDEVYAFGVYEKNGKIYITWTMAGGTGHNGLSRNLYVAYFDTADNTMHNVSGTHLGNTVNGGYDLDSCLVLNSQPNSSGSGYSDKHPIQNSQVSVSDYGQVFIGYGNHSVNPNVSIAKFVDGIWQFRTVESGTASFSDMVKCGDDDFEVLYVAQGLVKNKKTTDGGNTWSQLYSLAIPFGSSNADSVTYINFIENRSSISAVGGTINYAERQLDYTGKWPIFAIGTVTNNQVIALKAAANGKYIAAENEGTSSLRANRASAGTWEQFEIIDLGNNRIALKSLINGKYVCADNYGNDPLIANRTAIGTWETFEVITTPDGKKVLKALANNKYVCADLNRAVAGELIADRTSYSTWETFEFISQ